MRVPLPSLTVTPPPLAPFVQQYPQAEEAYLHVLVLDSGYDDARTELERTRLHCITVSQSHCTPHPALVRLPPTVVPPLPL